MFKRARLKVERADPLRDVVANGAHLLERPALRVGQVPVEVALAGM